MPLLVSAERGERVRLDKRIKKAQRPAQKTIAYEENLHHLADQMIKIDRMTASRSTTPSFRMCWRRLKVTADTVRIFMPKIDVEEQLSCDFCSRCPHARRAVLWFGTMRTASLLLSLSDWLPRVSTAWGPMPA